MTKARFLIALSLSAAGLAAQPALQSPEIGLIQAADHSLRPLYGIAGNFVLGDSMATGVVSAAFSGSLGLIKTDSALIAINRQSEILSNIDAPPGEALFGFSADGASALIYVGGPNQLFQWSQGTFAPVSFDPASFPRVSAVAFPDCDHAAIIVQRDDALWDVRISLATGKVDSQTALPMQVGPVMALASGDLIYRDVDGMVVRKSDGLEMHLEAVLPQRFSLQQIGENWIQIRDLDSNSQFALRLTTTREAVYALPEVEQ
jgi:hypothetical protein